MHEEQEGTGDGWAELPASFSLIPGGPPLTGGQELPQSSPRLARAGVILSPSPGGRHQTHASLCPHIRHGQVPCNSGTGETDGGGMHRWPATCKCASPVDSHASRAWRPVGGSGRHWPVLAGCPLCVCDPGLVLRAVTWCRLWPTQSRHTCIAKSMLKPEISRTAERRDG